VTTRLSIDTGATVEPAPLPASARSRYPGEFLALLARNHLALFRRMAEYGDVVQVRLGRQRLVLLNHPDDIQRMLATEQRNFVKGRALERVKILLGEGLLTSEAPRHLRQRRLMQPAFHRDRVAAYGAVMSEYARQTANAWQDGTAFDVHDEMMRLTRAIAGKTLFDLDVGHDPGGVQETIGLSLRLYRYALLPGGAVVEYLPLPFVRRVQRARARLNAWLADTIRVRRTEGGVRADLLSLLLAARDEDGSAMSDEDVRDELVTLLLAGHETTAVALSWSWYLLSSHPLVQGRLHAELDAVLGGRPPTADDMARLPYLRRILAESMRLYPPAWIVERRALGDFLVRGARIPGGSLVYASPFLVHHDDRWYQDPERFDPDRWLSGRDGTRPKFAYFPFGAGTRVCIGEQFAWMEGMLILATIAQRWQLQHDFTHQVAMEPLVTLRPKFGMRMRVSRRAPVRQPDAAA